MCVYIGRNSQQSSGIQRRQKGRCATTLCLAVSATVTWQVNDNTMHTLQLQDSVVPDRPNMFLDVVASTNYTMETDSCGCSTNHLLNGSCAEKCFKNVCGQLNAVEDIYSSPMTHLRNGTFATGVADPQNAWSQCTMPTVPSHCASTL